MPNFLPVSEHNGSNFNRPFQIQAVQLQAESNALLGVRMCHIFNCLILQYPNKQANKHTDRQADMQTDRQINKRAKDNTTELSNSHLANNHKSPFAPFKLMRMQSRRHLPLMAKQQPLPLIDCSSNHCHSMTAGPKHAWRQPS